MTSNRYGMGAALALCMGLALSTSGCSGATCEQAADKLVQCAAEAAGGSEGEGEAPIGEGEGEGEDPRQAFINDCQEIPEIARGAITDCLVKKSCDEINEAEDPVALCTQ